MPQLAGGGLYRCCTGYWNEHIGEILKGAPNTKHIRCPTCGAMMVKGADGIWAWANGTGQVERPDA